VAYSIVSWSLAHAYARTLYGYDTSAPPDRVTEPVPDLAAAPPRISADHRTYTFTLRAGVRYAPPVDREVVAQDFITAVERLYDPKTPSGGQPYARLIMGSAAFEHGRASTISGMRAVGPRTLAITLVRPAGDFLSILALPFFAPVPREYAAHYTVGANYSGYVVGSGPYTLARYVPGRSVVLVRNPNWDPATDPLRKAWVDRIEVKIGSNATTIQQALERGDADLTLDVEYPSARQRALAADPKEARQVQSLTNGCIQWLALETNRAAGPIADVRVRRAISYAIDKTAVLEASGGPLAGEPASTILSPVALGYHPHDPYPTPGHRGDPAKARQLLAQAGYPEGLTLNYVGANTGRQMAIRQVIQASLARAGIRLKVRTYDDWIASSMGVPAKRREHQVGLTTYCPDWPGDNARSIVVPLLDGQSIHPSRSSNFSEYDNPAVNRLIDQALAEPDRARRAELWGQLDKQVMRDAPWVPLTYFKSPFFVPASVQNWTFNPWTTTPDLTAVWLDPTKR
jgi:peptide/nickel transport system substrate-binding protein